MDREKDIFSEAVRNKLIDYSLPVDNDSWEAIEKRLNPVSRKHTLRLWISAIAVAASIALLLLFLPTNKKTYPNETAERLSDHEKIIIPSVTEQETVQQAPTATAGFPKVFRKSQPIEQLAENNITTEVTSKEEITKENSSVPAKEESNATVAENHPAPAVSRIDFGTEEQAPLLIKRKKQQSIRFSFGSGGSLLAKNTASMSFETANSGQNMAYDGAFLSNVNQGTVVLKNAQDFVSNGNYANVTHHLPLSFGVTIKKELNQTFAIESGVVYSFISTTFSKDFPLKSKADLQLHYIGIPLNLHTRLYKSYASQWEVYLSTGGMVEKGILSHFVKKDFYDDSSVTTTTLNEKIKGLQWSLSLSPGVDYKIHKNYSIYLEPKVSYYFDNDQPESARTEHPVVIGINAGVRYSW